MVFPCHLCLNPRMFFQPLGYHSLAPSEQQRVKIVSPKSPPNLCTLRKEKAIIKGKAASNGSDLIIFPCWYFHHRLFYIPPPLFFFAPPSSCSFRSHLLGAPNGFCVFCREGKHWVAEGAAVTDSCQGGFSPSWGIFSLPTQMFYWRKAWPKIWV